MPKLVALGAEAGQPAIADWTASAPLALLPGMGPGIYQVYSSVEAYVLRLSLEVRAQDFQVTTSM